MSLSEVEQEVLTWPEIERAHLLEVLWRSLVSGDALARSDAWTDEAERRLTAVESGALPLIDGANVIANLRSQLRS